MNIHESMLCRWVGYDIENFEHAHQPAPLRKPLKDVRKLSGKQIYKYLGYLRDALDNRKGLRVSQASDIDRVGATEPVAKPLPCLFFTELAAAAARAHCQLYGRLGFVFSKKFVFEHGGRPVIYTSSTLKKPDPIIGALNILRKALQDASTDSKIALEKWARFLKSTEMPAKNHAKVGFDYTKPKAARNKTKAEKQATSFPKHNNIPFLGEREWRLLRPIGRNSRWKESEGTLWFGPELGKELQIIIVPNNHLLELAYKSSDICKRLRGESGVSAQILSLEAIERL